MAMTLAGTDAVLRLYGHVGSKIEVDTLQGRDVEEFDDAWETLWSKLGQGWAAWLDGGELPLASFPWVDGSAEVNLAAYPRSAATGSTCRSGPTRSRNGRLI